MQVIVHPPRPLPPPAGGAVGAGDTGSDDDGGRDSSGSGRSAEGGGVFEGLVEVAARQATVLGGLKGEAAANATTLVVARPPLAEDFGEFLEVVEAVDDFIDDSGLRGTVQVGQARRLNTACWCRQASLLLNFFCLVGMGWFSGLAFLPLFYFCHQIGVRFSPRVVQLHI